MSVDLTAAKALISDALSDDEQAAWHREQKRQKAVELLGHVANVERLSEEIDTATGEDKKELQDALARSEKAAAVVARAVESFAAKEAAAAAKVARDKD